jgi:lysozyme family protein
MEELFVEEFYHYLDIYERNVKTCFTKPYLFNDDNVSEINRAKINIERMVSTNMINSKTQYGTIFDGLIRAYEATYDMINDLGEGNGDDDETLTFALKKFINNPNVNEDVRNDSDFIKYSYIFSREKNSE